MWSGVEILKNAYKREETLGSPPQLWHVSLGRAPLEGRLLMRRVWAESVKEMGPCLDGVFLSSSLSLNCLWLTVLLWLSITRRNLGTCPGWHEKGEMAVFLLPLKLVSHPPPPTFGIQLKMIFWVHLSLKSRALLSVWTPAVAVGSSIFKQWCEWERHACTQF